MAKLIKTALPKKNFVKAVFINYDGDIRGVTVDGNRVTVWAAVADWDGFRRKVILDAVVEEEEARGVANEILRAERPHEFEALFEYLSWAKPCRDSRGRIYICGEDEQLCEEDSRVYKCTEEELENPPDD